MVLVMGVTRGFGGFPAGAGALPARPVDRRRGAGSDMAMDEVDGRSCNLTFVGAGRGMSCRQLWTRTGAPPHSRQPMCANEER